MPHGLAGWSAPEVARMIERMKTSSRSGFATPTAMAAGSSR